jgi:hypothetical protein
MPQVDEFWRIKRLEGDTRTSLGITGYAKMDQHGLLTEPRGKISVGERVKIIRAEKFVLVQSEGAEKGLYAWMRYRDLEIAEVEDWLPKTSFRQDF